VGEDVAHQGLEGCAGGVCACEEHEEDFGSDVFGVEGFAFFVAGVDEAFALVLVFGS
jgi:hypothetical protein